MFIKGFWGIKILHPGRLGGLCLVLLLFGFSGCGENKGKTSWPKSGDKALDFVAQDLKGQTWTLDRVKGKVILLRFWTDQCPYCRYEMPVIEKYYRRLRPAGFEVLAVNVKQSPQVAEAFMAQMDITFPVLLDPSGKMAEHYKVYAVPTNFLIDRKGVLQNKLIGEAFQEENNLIKFLRNQFPDQMLQ
ncbi:MAG: TlpA family protein disulfide reductase [Deltaproteobacteria bacterium]|nr:TlpA family protein disulfide reductase [Deltaproteobacteria bacterium]